MTRIARAACAALSLVCCAPSPRAVAEEVASPEVLITGSSQRSAESSSKLDVPLMDLPVSRQYVSHELMEARGLRRLDEAVDSVAGVRRYNGFPGATGYFVRGFYEGFDLLRDGFRDINFGVSDLVGIERVEVLKGPAAVLYGGNLSAGGVINLVARQPQSRAATALSVSGGSDDYWRATLDSTGVLGTGDSLLYRAGLSVEDGGDFRDQIRSRQWAMAPSLQWSPTEADTLRVRADYVHADFRMPADFPMHEAVLDIPIERYLLEPGTGGSRARNRRLTADYQHRLSRDWKLRLAASTARFDIDIGIDRLFYPFLEADGRTMPRPLSAGPQETANEELQAELYGKFSTGALEHVFVAGAGALIQDYLATNDWFDLGPIDILEPVYGAQPVSLGLHTEFRSTLESAGLFAQDLVSLTPRIKALAALRRERMVTGYEDPLAATRTETRDWATTWRVGAVYQPIESTALYASTATSFVPNIYSRAVDGSILEPTTGRQWEIGAKQMLRDGRLSASLALFEIERRDIPTPDLANPGFSVNRGEQRSRGVEVELSGEMSPGWDLDASYAYTDAEVVRDAALASGETLAGVPRNALSVWSRYRFRSGALRGFGFGAGVFHASEVQATLPNSFELPGYTRWDLLAQYELSARTRLSVNVKNLTGVKYYDTDGAYTLRPNPPRTVVAGIAVQF